MVGIALTDAMLNNRRRLGGRSGATAAKLPTGLGGPQIHPRPLAAVSGAKLPTGAGGPQIHPRPPVEASGAKLPTGAGGPQIHPRSRSGTGLLRLFDGRLPVDFDARTNPRGRVRGARPARDHGDHPVQDRGGFRGGGLGDFRGGGRRGGGAGTVDYEARYGGYNDRSLQVTGNTPLDNEITDWREFLNTAQVLIPELADSLDSTALIDQAREDATVANSQAQEARRLAMERRGIKLSDAQASYLNRADALNAATNTAQTVNNARLDQQQRNDTLLQNMANFAGQVQSLAGDNVRSANHLASQRAMNNRAAREQQRQELTSMATTLITAGLFGL